MTNNIQKQKGISLIDFLEHFDSEEKCERYLEKLKWSKGFRCSKCGGTSYYKSKTKNGRLFYRCKSSGCKHRNHLLVGTMFQATKLPLKKWFLAIYFMTQGKKGISTLDLMRKLNVKEDTAHLMRLKIMTVMQSRESGSQLENIIQIDDAYYGGKHEGKSGRGSENKQAFLAAVSTDDEGHPLKVKLEPLKSFTKEGVAYFAKKFLAKYFAEFQYRFNRRFDLKALPDRFFYTSVHYFTPITLDNLKNEAA